MAKITARPLVAANIIRLRKKLKWTADDLAEKAGTTAVKGIEAGRREGRVGTLEKIASALGVEVSGLFKPIAARRRPKTGRKEKAA